MQANWVKRMENKQTFLIPRLQQVVQLGIMVDRYSQDFPKEICGKNNILPCYYLILTHQGMARVVYDAQEAALVPNMVVRVRPYSASYARHLRAGMLLRGTLRLFAKDRHWE